MGSIRKAIGAVKDQTSIGIAKVVAGNVSPDLEILIVKATSHDEDPPGEKYVREIVSLTGLSQGYVDACMAAISKRLGRTRDWIVALKAVMVVHRLITADGSLQFQEEMLYAKRRGTRIVNMWGFKGEAQSNSWDHSRFVRAYASYVDQKLDFMAYQRRRLSFRSGGSCDHKSWPTKEMRPERVLEKAIQLQRLLERFLGCRPTGEANNNRLVFTGIRLIATESFELYAGVREALDLLFDGFSEMEYKECVMALQVYVGASKQVVELEEFYGWCKDTRVFPTSSHCPPVQRISGKLLETLEETLKERAKRPSPTTHEEEIPHKLVGVTELAANANANDLKAALPDSPSPTPEPTAEMTMMMMMMTPPSPKEEAALVNLEDEHSSSHLALPLFSQATNTGVAAWWEAFPSNGGEPEVTSAASPTPAAHSGKPNWEVALLESASNLSRQEAALAGGFHQSLLTGIYDQGTVRQQVTSLQLGDGSASSVAFPGLPPNGTVQAVGQQDPFVASLLVPPPSYVQLVDMERKQQLLLQEQQTWLQYGSTGVQGQLDLGNIRAGFT